MCKYYKNPYKHKYHIILAGKNVFIPILIGQVFVLDKHNTV